MLSPFVHLWGLDYDRLKLVTVALFVAWVVLLFGIVRRRLGRWPALGVTAVIATSPAYLLHTDQLISEYAFFVTIAVVIWWCDRIQRDADVIGAGRHQLVVLGVLMALAFNVRREAMVLVAVVAVLQLVALLTAGDRRRSLRRVLERIRAVVALDRHPVRLVRRLRRAVPAAPADRLCCPTTATAGRSSRTDSARSPRPSPTS